MFTLHEAYPGRRVVVADLVTHQIEDADATLVRVEKNEGNKCTRVRVLRSNGGEVSLALIPKSKGWKVLFEGPTGEMGFSPQGPTYIVD